MAEEIFKTCPNCRKRWYTLEDFLGDPQLVLVGYQGVLRGPDHGFLYLNHMDETCKTTLAITIGEFADLYDGPLVEKHRQGSEPCPEHCFFTNGVVERPEGCECRYVRSVMKRIETWSKR